MKKITAILLFVLFVLTACSRTGAVTTPPVTATTSPLPTATETKILPTPASLNDSIIWDELQVTMEQLETTQDYLTDFGSTRIPPEGKKFLWVHIRLENLKQIEMNVPLAEHFSVLYAATEIKPTYGYRQAYTEYIALGPVIFPDQELDGWLRFDIPAVAELSDLLFVFLPESAQIGTSYFSPNYPYSEDKPTYVWQGSP